MAVGVDPDTARMLQGLAHERGFRWRACSSAASLRAAEALAARHARPDLVFLLDADAARSADILRKVAQEIILVVDPDQLRRPRESHPEVDLLCRPLDRRFVGRLLDDVAAEFQRTLGYSHGAGAPPLDQFGGLEGSAAVMRQLFQHMRRMARSGGSVLIYGERGTGKARAAEALHRAGRGAAGPFVVVDARDGSPIPTGPWAGGRNSDPQGSFWAERFERARGGTLFVDHLGELPLQAQIPLLQALENPSVTRSGGSPVGLRPVRVIAAVDRDPLVAIRGGRLRQDLYDRLGRFVVRVPPLRERQHDVVDLAWQFLSELNDRFGTAKVLSREATELMKRHAWPGNVGELKNVIEHAHASAGEVIGPESLPSAVSGGDALADREAGELGDIV
jgi:two-component system, NtrC family, response regulator HydG